MFACCNLCYVKYIREDGSIDAAVYRKALKERGLKEPNPEKPICMCLCHVKGSQVIH